MVDWCASDAAVKVLFAPLSISLPSIYPLNLLQPNPRLDPLRAMGHRARVPVADGHRAAGLRRAVQEVG